MNPPDTALPRHIIIMMGIPGSGKDHYINNLTTPTGEPLVYQDRTSVVSADDHFMVCTDCGFRLEDHPTPHPKATRPLTSVSCYRSGENHRFEYKFDIKRLASAHALCLWNFTQDIRIGNDHVFVNNTNTSIAELAPYISLAKGLEAVQEKPPTVKVIHIACDPLVAAKRNVHGVDGDHIMAMHDRLTATLENWPRFWPTPESVVSNG